MKSIPENRTIHDQTVASYVYMSVMDALRALDKESFHAPAARHHLNELLQGSPSSCKRFFEVLREAGALGVLKGILEMADLSAEAEYIFSQKVEDLTILTPEARGKANELARHLHAAAGFEPRKEGYDFFESNNFFEQTAFKQACIAINFQKVG